MRRILAVWLQAILIASLFGPLLQALSAQSDLPACCRRDGKHHCGMENKPSSSGPAFKAEKCSTFPTPPGVIASHEVALTPQRIALAAAFNTAESVLYLAVSHPSTAILIASPKRGPPAVSL